MSYYGEKNIRKKLDAGRLSLFEEEEQRATAVGNGGPAKNNAPTTKKSQNGTQGQLDKSSVPSTNPQVKPPKISALHGGERSKGSVQTSKTEEKDAAEKPISLKARIKVFQQEHQGDVSGRAQSVMVRQKKPPLPVKPKRWISDPEFKGLPRVTEEKKTSGNSPSPLKKTGQQHQHPKVAARPKVGDNDQVTTLPKDAKPSPGSKFKKTPPQKPQRKFLTSISVKEEGEEEEKDDRNLTSPESAVFHSGEEENKGGVKSIRERIQAFSTPSAENKTSDKEAVARPGGVTKRIVTYADAVATPKNSPLKIGPNQSMPEVSSLHKVESGLPREAVEPGSPLFSKNYRSSSGKVIKMSKPTVAPPKQPSPSSSSSSSSLPSAEWRLPPAVNLTDRPLPSLPDTPPWRGGGSRSQLSFLNRMYSDVALPVVFDDALQPSRRRYSDEPTHLVLPAGQEVIIDAGGYAQPIDSHSLLRRTKTVSPMQSPSMSRPFRQRSFSLDDDTATPNEDLEKESKRHLLQKKINDVFITLSRLGHRARKPSLSQDKEDGYDSDEESTDLEHKKRLFQLKSVKEISKYCTTESAKNSRMGNYPKLFDCILTIGLMPEKGKGHRPYIKDIYPPEGEYARVEDKVAAIPQFAFPDPDNWQMEATQSSEKSETYCFVLTNIDATRKYGCCRRVEPPLGEGLPEVYCILTPFPCVNLYSKVLDQIETRRKVSSARVKTFLEAAYPKPLPKPGQMVIIQVEGKGKHSWEKLKLKRPRDSRLENADFECLLRTLNIDNILKIFASILLERRIVFSAENLSTLSKCVTAMSALLYPFSWQHAYIPVLPTHLVEMCCAPTPYIIGVTASCLNKVISLEREEILLVNLDTDCFEVCHGDESTLLPRKLQMALKESLHHCLNYETMNEMEMSLNEIFSEAFIRFFVETVGHYRHHMKPSSSDGYAMFQPESFRKVVPSKSIRKFLELFMESQMFSVFIEIKEVDSMEDEFDRLVREYTEASSIGFRQKMKNWGRAIKLSAIESGQKIKDTAIKVKYSFENQI